MTSLVETLEDVLQLLDSPEKWVQGSLAITAENGLVSPLDEAAVAWCLVGAVRRAAAVDEMGWARAVAFLDQRARDEFQASAVEMNDNMLDSYEDMRLFLKRAIAEAETL